ncbi:hypothetical protein OSTOST_09309, partial [Ostertagia ostertagi]
DVDKPRTCDEFKNRTDAVKTIYINNAAVDVYCQYGNPGAYTVIQSRGSNDDTTFNREVEDYKKQFGTISKDSYILNAEAVIPKIGLDFISTNSGKKDIGVPFTTFNKMSDNMKDSCDILRYYGERTNVPEADKGVEIGENTRTCNGGLGHAFSRRRPCSYEAALRDGHLRSGQTPIATKPFCS